MNGPRTPTAPPDLGHVTISTSAVALIGLADYPLITKVTLGSLTHIAGPHSTLRALAAHLSRVADSLTISRQAAIDALGTMRANGYDDTDVDAFTISDIGGGQLRGYLLTRDGLLPGDAMAHADHICETTGSAMFGGPAGSRAQRAYYATTTRYDGE